MFLVHAAIGYSKISRKIATVQCTDCDQKETGGTRAPAADTFDLQEVSNGGHGCIQVGRMDLIFQRCMECQLGLAMKKMSVRPSVCLSVRPSVCQTRRL